MSALRHRGFTLIELMVSLSIAALLLVLAAPSYVRWLEEAEVLNGANSLATGLQTAQAEAIKRNINVQFVIDPTTQTGGWIAQMTDGTALQQGHFQGGAERVTFAASPVGQTTVTFTPLGQILEDLANPQDDRLQRVTLSATNSTLQRQVVIGIDQAGARRSSAKTHVCDPNSAFSAPDPSACPP